MNIWIWGADRSGFCYEQTKMVHTRHNQSYVCGIWCRDINSPAGLQECNFFHTEAQMQCTGDCHLHHQLTSMKTSASVWVWYTWQSSWAKKAFCGQSRHNMTHATVHTFRLFLWGTRSVPSALSGCRVHIPSFPDHSHLQSLITCSMQIRRTEIWSCAVTSARHTGGGDQWRISKPFLVMSIWGLDTRAFTRQSLFATLETGTWNVQSDTAPVCLPDITTHDQIFQAVGSCHVATRVGPALLATT